MAVQDYSTIDGADPTVWPKAIGQSSPLPLRLEDRDVGGNGRGQRAHHGSRSRGPELLAAQAGRALDNAQKYARLKEADGALRQSLFEQQRIQREREVLEAQLRQSQKMGGGGTARRGVAHDFNNLLAVIQNYAHFVLEELESGDYRRDDVQEIIKAGDRASTLVRHLLTFSRKQVVQPEVVDLNEIIEDPRSSRRTIGEHISLRTELEPSLWAMTADGGRWSKWS